MFERSKDGEEKANDNDNDIAGNCNTVVTCGIATRGMVAVGTLVLHHDNIRYTYVHRLDPAWIALRGGSHCWLDACSFCQSAPH